ncbi:protein lifeguard 2-like [Haliotis rufescens]|uniref:protein lifeguard 2-like n=1 Tax=Haliotis rufescens TaxID=6454 RepID=UPI00201ECFF0|nr:protein lifeguard 2-like [Haliotis rufescens]
MSKYPAEPPPSYDQADGYGYDQNQPPSTGIGFAPVEMGQGQYNTAYSETTPAPASYRPPPQQALGTFPPPRVEPKPEDNDAFNGIVTTGFSDKAIRRSFIRKVYLILMSQLLITVGFICLFIYVNPIRNWVQTDGFWFYYVSYGTFLVTYFVLICIPSVRRQTPGNYICLIVFTLAFSYMVGTISCYYSTNIVLIMMGITTLVCLSISLFAIQTKIDFTMCSGLLFVLVMVLFFFGWSCLFTFYAYGYNRILDCVYGGLAALVFGLFLIYDTQMIVGGRKHQLSPEEYIFGALQLYIDVVYLFLILLSLFGKSN